MLLSLKLLFSKSPCRLVSTELTDSSKRYDYLAFERYTALI